MRVLRGGRQRLDPPNAPGIAPRAAGVAVEEEEEVVVVVVVEAEEEAEEEVVVSLKGKEGSWIARIPGRKGEDKAL